MTRGRCVYDPQVSHSPLPVTSITTVMTQFMSFLTDPKRRLFTSGAILAN